MNVNVLRALVARDKNIDELVATDAQLAALKASYEANEVETPAWVNEKAEEVKLEIKAQTRAARQAELAKLRVRREALKTADEKRRDLDTEIARLEKGLA